MKLRTVIADYFSFNRAEQRGITILLIILFTLLILNRFWPSRPVLPNEAAAAFDREVAAFASGLKEKKPEKRKRYTEWKHYSAFPATRSDTGYRMKKSTAPSFIIELNSADTLELQRLRGIGSGFARRIVSYRSKLGGYHDKRQLMEVYGMDAERYGMICDHVTVNPDSVRRIDINNVTFKALMGHPYFPYELTREIILYRKKAKRFNAPEEIMKVKGVTDSVYRKISSYIVVN